MTFRETIADAIRVNRPKLSASSTKTYVSTLVNLHKQLCHDDPKDDSIDWFKTHCNDILEHFKDTAPRQRKSILSACYVLTEEPEFRKLMIDDCKSVNEDYKNQKMDAKEKENWVEPEDIQRIYDDLKTKVGAMFSQKSMPHTPTIVEYFLLAVLGGVAGIPPRRSMDYGLLKIRNFDPATDNFYRAGKFVFNRYKTAPTYGRQVLDVPPELNKMIKKWIKLKTASDYLLVSTNGQPLSSPLISRILNKVFGGKKVSTDMLRHIYLTNVYKHTPALRQMETLANQMGHSVATQMLYVKKS
jgi:integrase